MNEFHLGYQQAVVAPMRTSLERCGPRGASPGLTSSVRTGEGSGAVGPCRSTAIVALALAAQFFLIRRRDLPLLGSVFENQREETAQPVLGIWARVEVDTHNPQFLGVPAGGLLPCLALDFFQVDALVAYSSRSASEANAGPSVANAVPATSVGGGRTERYPLEGTTGALSLGRDFIGVMDGVGSGTWNRWRRRVLSSGGGVPFILP